MRFNSAGTGTSFQIPVDLRGFAIDNAVLFPTYAFDTTASSLQPINLLIDALSGNKVLSSLSVASSYIYTATTGLASAFLGAAMPLFGRLAPGLTTALNIAEIIPTGAVKFDGYDDPRLEVLV